MSDHYRGHSRLESGQRGNKRGRGGYNRNYRGDGQTRNYQESPTNRADEHHAAKKQNQESAKKQEEKTETIYAPATKPVEWPLDTKCLVICYDLENAYGSELSEIYQIGLVSSLAEDAEGGGSNKLLVNMLPVGQIHWGVTKYAGTNIETKFDKQTNEKFLFHVKKRERLDSVEPREGLQQIVEWIKAQKESSSCDKVILVAHGNMDAPCLLNNLHHYGLLDELKADGFGDTVPYIKNRLAAAFERLFPGQRFEAHNALADAEALLKIMCKKQPPGSGER